MEMFGAEPLIQVLIFLAVIAGVLLVLVMFKLMFLLHALYETLILFRHELSPLLMELRQSATHVEQITGSVSGSVQALQKGVSKSQPALLQTFNDARQGGVKLQHGLHAVWQGLKKSFDTV